MDNFFSDTPAPDAGAPPDPGTAAADPNAPPDPGAADPAAGAPPADPAAAPPAAAAADPAAALELPAGATLDGNQIRVDLPQWNNFYKDYKFAQELRNIAPDLNTAKTHYQRATDLRHMHSDFTAGNADAFLDFWQAQSPAGFEAMARAAYDRAPEAVRQEISNRAVSAVFDQLYAKAAETGDPHDLYRARQAEYYATGDWRKDTAPKVDPLAAREKAIATREQQFQQRENQRAEQGWKTWTNQTYAAIGTQLTAQIDDLLKPIASRFAQTPNIFQTLRSSIKTQAIRASEADGEWLRNFNMDLNNSRRTMSPGDRQALVQQYNARVSRILTGIAAPLIKEATALQVQQNQNAHDRLAAGSARRGAAAPGAPVRTSVSTGQRDRSAMTLEEKIDLDMASA